MKAFVLSGRPDLYSTRRIADELAALGLDTRVVDYRRCSLGIGPRPSVTCDGEVLHPNLVVPRIGHKSTRFGAAVVRQFQFLGARSTLQPGGILRARDKFATMQALAMAGIPVPSTAAARSPSGMTEVLDAVGGAPLVVKLVEGTHGTGVVLAETRKAAESLLAAFHQLDADMCVQEFVKEASGQDIRVIVVNGRPVAAMLRKGAPGEFRANLHQGGEGFPVELSDLERQVAIAAAACVGVDVAGVDLLRTERGPLVLEVNVSPGLSGIESVTGVNVAAEIAQFAAGLLS